MKRRLSVFMLTIAVLNLLLGFLNPILCFESDGRIQIEFSNQNQCNISEQRLQKNQIGVNFSQDHCKTCLDIPALNQAISVRAYDNHVIKHLIPVDLLNQNQFTLLFVNFLNFSERPASHVLISQFERFFLNTVIILI